MEFLLFLVRRALWSLLVLFGLSVVIFTIARGMPGDPVRLALGPRASNEQVEQFRQTLGFDKPLIQQYGIYVSGLVSGDLGLSLLTKRPVSNDIRETFAATFELVLATITIAFLFGVPLGVAAARWKDKWPDNLVRLIAIFSAVTPSFFLALVLQILAGYVLHILPTTGRLPPGMVFSADITGLVTLDSLLHGRLDVFGEGLRYLLLPSLALSAATMGRDRPHHALLDDRRRQSGLYRGEPCLWRSRACAGLQIYVAAEFRSAAHHFRPRIRIADRQRLRRRTRLRLARHGRLWRAHHHAEGPERQSWAW